MHKRSFARSRHRDPRHPTGRALDLGFDSGADPNRVAIVPHGVDMSIFHAPTREQRTAVRGELGVEQDQFVFLVVGAMTDNKNLP